MTKILNRVGMLISTAGTGTITAAVPISNKFLTPAEAGAVDGEQYFWLLEEGNDFELFKGSWIAASMEISRDEVIASKIGGVAGATKMTLAGGATLRSALPREGVAQGWTLIETIVASSGNNKVFDNIPDAYSELMIVGQNLDATKSGFTSVKYDYSINNGSSYFGADQSFATVTDGGAGFFNLHFVGVQLPIGYVVMPFGSTGFPQTTEELSSRINAIKISLDQAGGASNFTGSGTLKLYGR